jgi:hypothetical protein
MKYEVNKTKALHSLCTVGGFVVGTAALRTLVHDKKTNPTKTEMLRGTFLGMAPVRDRSPFNGSKNLELDPLKLHPSVSTAASINDNGNDFGTNATSPYGKVGSPSLASLTNETQSVSVSRRTSLLSSGFCLKLRWQRGYYWQESFEETWWCMSCGIDGRCKEDEVMRLVSFPVGWIATCLCMSHSLSGLLGTD